MSDTSSRPRDLMRFAAIGSVDDGKSTLIGRLLLDTGSIYTDQWEQVERASRARGDAYIDLALVTDGLRDERAQGITIDVAYRYFSTPRRSFVIADCPGHVQYTRNMVTGASLADLALLVVDVRNGVVQQTRRHAFIASLLGVPHVVVCVNKMDLVGFDERAFEHVRSEFTSFAARLRLPDVTFVPISALQGDNVTRRSERMPWFDGASLLHLLENVHIASDRDLVDVRFPVQVVIRPRSDAHHDYRGYAGQVAGGVLKPGDEVVVLPSGVETVIASIESYGAPIAEAYPPMCVTVRLADDVDVSRGDMIARPHNRPRSSQEIEAMLCVLTTTTLQAGRTYAILHTTRMARATVTDVRYKVDVDTLHRDTAMAELAFNEVGRVRLRTTVPLLHDAYRRNRTTGSFILIDESDNQTVAAGLILDQDA